jgi:hypothetical protein
MNRQVLGNLDRTITGLHTNATTAEAAEAAEAS